MSGNVVATPQDWVDEDDAPELDDAWFESASLKLGDLTIERARDVVVLDREIADQFRSADGTEWRHAVNEALRQILRDRSA